MEAPPSSTLVAIETDPLLKVLEVALDAPAQLGRVNERVDRGCGGQRGEPVFGRCVLALRPLDQRRVSFVAEPRAPTGWPLSMAAVARVAVDGV